MLVLHAIILGILEGFTEFLPISSTAHLILASKLLKIPESDTLTLFLITVQVGAILAVLVYFYKKFFSVKLWKKLIIAFIPTGIAGLLIYPYIKFLLSSPWILVVTLSLGGVIMIAVEKWYTKRYLHTTSGNLSDISYKQSFLLGCFQALAIIPGTSRSGATIIGGLMMGLRREVLTEFTFLLAVPTMIVATAYSVYKQRELLALDHVVTPLLVGTTLSFIVALIVIKSFLAYIRTRSFEIFGWYRIVLAVVVALVLMYTN